MRAVTIVIIITLAYSCSEKKEPVRYWGETQGTTYSIIYTSENKSLNHDDVRSGTEILLKDFDFSLSTYNKESLITDINNRVTDSMDIYLEEVFLISQKIWKSSGGAFDITAAPLINAWGFGPDGVRTFREEARDSLLSLVGMDKVSIANGRISLPEGMSLDVNGVAQGYSVDLVADLLESYGISNYLVEIGGEVRTAGSKYGSAWRVGVDKPFDGNYNSGEHLQAVIELSGRSLATSGNYRKYYIDKEGKKYSHTIDPRTGYPARNRILSATIIAPDCGSADAWATACMVADVDKAIEFIKNNPELEGYFIYAGPKGEFLEWMSEGMEKLIQQL